MIYIQTRNMKVVVFSKGCMIQSITLVGESLGMLKIANSFFIGYYEGNIDVLTIKGQKKIRSINLPVELVAMENMYFQKLNESKGLIIALKNKEIRIYDKKGVTILNVLKLDVSFLK